MSFSKLITNDTEDASLRAEIYSEIMPFFSLQNDLISVNDVKITKDIKRIKN